MVNTNLTERNESLRMSNDSSLLKLVTSRLEQLMSEPSIDKSFNIQLIKKTWESLCKEGD